MGWIRSSVINLFQLEEIAVFYPEDKKNLHSIGILLKGSCGENFYIPFKSDEIRNYVLEEIFKKLQNKDEWIDIREIQDSYVESAKSFEEFTQNS